MSDTQVLTMFVSQQAVCKWRRWGQVSPFCTMQCLSTTCIASPVVWLDFSRQCAVFRTEGLSFGQLASQQGSGFGQQGPGFAQQGSGFGQQQGSGFGQQGPGFAQQGSGFGQQGSGFAQQGSGSGAGVDGHSGSFGSSSMYVVVSSHQFCTWCRCQLTNGGNVASCPLQDWILLLWLEVVTLFYKL